jgi:hypothetical protein
MIRRLIKVDQILEEEFAFAENPEVFGENQSKRNFVTTTPT